MQITKKSIVYKLGRGTSLPKRQAATRHTGQQFRIVKANQEKVQGSLRIKLVE